MKLVLCIGLMLFVLVKTERTQHCTQSSLDKLLTRKKRHLTFPDGSSFAVKRSFSKAIIDNIPRGMVLNIDCGIYYPLPGSKDPWNPSKFLYRLGLARTDGLSATPKPKLKSKVDTAVDSTGENIGVVDVKYTNPDLYFPSKHYASGNRKPSWHGIEYYTGTASKPEWNRRKTHQPISKHYNLLSHRLFNDSGATLDYNTIYRNSNHYSPQNSLTTVHFKNSKSSTHFGSAPWSHHREYRERREIYAKSEGLGHIFGINMKACILRAICEMNDDFLPPGKSLILDTARILFDLPTDHDFEDDYGTIAKEKGVNCAKRFHYSCPHSPFDFLLNSVRLRGLKNSNEIQNSFVYT